jgi:hypothetical protein
MAHMSRKFVSAWMSLHFMQQLMTRLAKIKKLSGTQAAEHGDYMIVNTEWGAFNNSVRIVSRTSEKPMTFHLQRTYLPFTPFDKALDRRSINPSFQAFEKFVSGMYLGEVVRNIFISLIDAAPKSLLFNGKTTLHINKHYGIDTSLLSSVEEAWQGNGEIGPVIQFSKFDPEALDASVNARLEQVRQVIVGQLGFHDDDVSLRDAAVPCFCHRLFPGAYDLIDCSMGMRTGGSTSGVVQWCCCRSCFITNGPCCSARGARYSCRR